MGLGLSIVGDLRDGAADTFVTHASAWMEKHAAPHVLRAKVDTEGENGPTLSVLLHPSAEDLEITLLDERSVRASGKTSTTGPGYHAFVCDLLHRLGADLGIAWRPPTDDELDETGYFHDPDVAALEGEFLAWLRGLAGAVLDAAEDGSTGIAISMPMNVRFEVDAFLITPVGPRSLAWTREVASDPRCGVDLFPWWEVGSDCALGRALIPMWQDVPWRPPVDDEERALLENVDALLARAHASGAKGVPWTEWAEILRYLDKTRAEVAAHAMAEAPRALIGYRRANVWNAMAGGWSLSAPGRFVGRFDEKGTWSAFDGSRTLWFSSFSVDGPGDRVPSAKELIAKGKDEGAPVQVPGLADKAHRARLSRRDDGDGEYQWLVVEVAEPGNLAVFSMAFHDDADLALGRDVAGSLACSRKRESA
jgi:hypothetical protein